MNLNDALKYSAADEKALLKLMASHEDHRKAGATTRLVAADYFDEQGNKDFANYLRSPHPLPVTEKGTVLKASLKAHRLLSELHHRYATAYSHDAADIGQQRLDDPLTQEAITELERLGRSHEADMLKTLHPLTYKKGLLRGSYPEHRWSGGGTVVYDAASGGDVFCPQCRNGGNGSRTISPDAEDDPQWQIYGHDREHAEGPPEYCVHCNKELVSTYGDPDAEEE